MDQSSLPSSRANGKKSKENFKELNLVPSQLSGKGRAGRESPESGSLYSDYESGQQYEDKVGLVATWMPDCPLRKYDAISTRPTSDCPFQDLPSGYNSGEQYDTMSTGYMSGEAYELPEAREPLMVPTLASVEEISGSLRSEDLFTLTHSQVLYWGLHVRKMKGVSEMCKYCSDRMLQQGPKLFLGGFSIIFCCHAFWCRKILHCRKISI